MAPSMMKIHLHPEKPRTPSTGQASVNRYSSTRDWHFKFDNVRLPIAEARRPPKAPASEVEEKNSEYRF